MRFIILSLLITLITHFPSFAYARMEEVTKEVDRSMREELLEKLKPVPKKTPEIKKKEEKEEKKEKKASKFFIKKIHLSGCESYSPDEFKLIIEKYEGEKSSLDELTILTKEIEKKYLSKGIIAACFIPPQKIEKEILTLSIVEAKMGELNIKDHEYFKQQRINYYWKIKPDEVLYFDKISRSLQLMNKNPDRDIKAILHAGKKPETTDVFLKVKSKFPIHLTSTFDREGSVPTGIKRKGIGIRHNNFLGLDDMLLNGYTFGKNFSGIYTYHIIPVTNFGTSILYGYSYSKSFPKKEYTSSGIDSRSKNCSFFIYQDIFKKDKYLGVIHIGLESKDKTTKINNDTVNRDRLRILKLGSNFIKRGFNTSTSLNTEFSQGINFFGAKRKNSLSSREAKNTFSKFNQEINYMRNLPLRLQLKLNLKNQLSSTKLPPQEEFSLGGIDSVRGYPSGDYLADNALQTNIELLIPAFFIPETAKIPYIVPYLKNTTTFIAFFDYGFGKKRGTISTEKETSNLKSIGAGLRTQLFNKAMLRLEWGFPVGDNTMTENANSRFHISLQFEI